MILKDKIASMKGEFMFRLLLAENEYIEREAMKHIIHQKYENSYEIMEATNGKEAILLAQIHQPDVLLLDIKMPGCSGIQAAKEIREFLPNAIILFISAYDCFDYAKEAISLRVEEFLVKPVEIQVIYQVLDRVTKRLEREIETKDESKELEFKFSMIKKQFEIEFVQALENYTTTKDTLNHYLQVMDIPLGVAIIGYLDFSTIANYEQNSTIQKEFIRERLLEKVKQICEMNRVMLVSGDMKDQMPLVFFREEEPIKEFQTSVENILTRSIQMLGLTITYQIGNVVTEIGKLPLECFRLREKIFSKYSQEKKQYPIELEDELLDCVKKKEFDVAKEIISRLSELLEQMYQGKELEREILGLYAVVKRTMVRCAPELLMEHSDRLVEGISTGLEMESFFYRLFDYANSKKLNRPDKNQLLIKKLCDYVEEHYQEEISLEQAASIIGFSPFYFARLIKEHLNMSFIDYLTSVRIENAKKLLDTTTLSVKEVGALVGYEDANYFTRVFKRTEGMTPSSYKQK